MMWYVIVFLVGLCLGPFVWKLLYKIIDPHGEL